MRERLALPNLSLSERDRRWLEVRKALKFMGDEFKPGMVFAFNIDLANPKWRNGATGCVFAETIVVTEDRPRRLHTFPTEFQIIKV